MSRLILAEGRERSIQRRHPWIFAGAVAEMRGRARAGDTVEVLDHGGRALGKAACSPDSQIRARMWTFDAAEVVDHAFFKRRIRSAIERRDALPQLRGRQTLRLVNAESDGLPGVVADRYGATIVLQLTSAGAERWRSAIASALAQITSCERLYERSDTDARGLEGLEPRCGALHGPPPESEIVIDEDGVRIAADVVGGHKTGFYIDQRDNRLLARALSENRRVLNCFCYSGGFSLQAMAGNAAEVVSIDSSGPALALAQRSLALNPGLDPGRASWVEADVFEALREMRKAGERFDLVVLDPPKFAASSAHVQRASRAYKDINLLAFQLLRPGGLLLTFSCSGWVTPELFQKIVASAAVDAGIDVVALRRLGAGPDHPVSLAFPEGDYLKGLLCQRA